MARNNTAEEPMTRAWLSTWVMPPSEAIEDGLTSLASTWRSRGSMNSSTAAVYRFWATRQYAMVQASRTAMVARTMTRRRQRIRQRSAADATFVAIIASEG